MTLTIKQVDEGIMNSYKKFKNKRILAIPIQVICSELLDELRDELLRIDQIGIQSKQKEREEKKSKEMEGNLAEMEYRNLKANNPARWV